MHFDKQVVIMLMVTSLLHWKAWAACQCDPTNLAYIDCWSSKAEPGSTCGAASLAITTQSFVFNCLIDQVMLQNPAAGSNFWATTKDQTNGGCNGVQIIDCYSPSQTVLQVTAPSWVFLNSGLTSQSQTVSASGSAGFALWAKVPANTNSAQTVTVEAQFGSTTVDARSYTLGQCVPEPLIWSTAGYTIPAQTHYYNSGLATTITVPLVTRTLACVTCPPVYSYAVKVAGSLANVSYMTATSTSITITSSTVQPDTSFVFSVRDDSTNPRMEYLFPFTVAWKDLCSTTTFDVSTFTVAAMQTYVTSPPSAIVSQAKVFKDTISAANGNNDGYTFCNPRTYTFSGPAQASLFSYDTASNSIKLAAPTLAHYSASPLTITLQVCLVNFPTICQSTTFTATIGCKITSAALTNIPNKSYSTGGAIQSIPFPTITLTPACPYTPTWLLKYDSVPYANDQLLSIASGTSLQIGKTTTSLNFMTTPNPHTVTLEASFPLDPNLTIGTKSFQLTLTDSCLTTSLTRATAITDMQTSILVPVTQAASMRDTASNTLGNLDGTTLCGLRTYSMVVKDSSNNVVPAPPFISIDPCTGLITLNPNAPPATDVGSYTAEILTSLVSYPSITDLTTINVVINPCQVTSITHAPSTLANVNFVFLVDTSLGPFSYPVYTQVPACNYAYDFQIQVNGVTQTSPYLFLTYTQTDYTVATTDFALVGTSYAMTLVYSLLSYSYATVASDSTVTWTVAIKTTCFITALDPMGAFATMTTTVLAPTATTQAFTDVKDSQSKTYDPTPTSYEVTSNDPVVTSGPLVGTTFCGPRTYTITGGASCAALSITSNPSPYYLILNLSSSDPAQLTAGTSCTVTAKLQDHPLVVAVTNTVNVVINPCIVTSFTQDAPNLPTQFYTMMGTVLSVPFPTFTQTPTCNYVITYTCQVVVGGVASSYTTNPNLFSMTVCDTTNKLFTVNIEKGGALTTLNAQIPKAGDYQIQVTARLNNVPATVDSGFNFMLTVLNPCVSSNTIDATTVTSLASVPGTVMQDMTTSVRAAAQPVIQTFNAYKDYASRTYGNLNGLTLCGLRTYAVTQIVVGSFSAFSTWFTQPTAATNAINQVSINAQNDLDLGCNTMRLTVALQSYPSVTMTQDFQVCIIGCQIVDFQENSGLPNLSMRVFYDGPTTVTFPTYTQTPLCGYPITFKGEITDDVGTVTALPNALYPFVTTFDQIKYIIKSNSVSEKGVYTLKLIATLPDNPGTPAINSDVTWTLELIDPCLTTVVNGDNVVITDMLNSVKNVYTTTQTFPEFRDQLSIDSLGLLNCGPITYTLGGAYTGLESWINFNQATRTINVRTNKDLDIKYSPGYAVTFTACLTNYPTNCYGPKPFSVEIEPCKVTSFVISSPQTDFTYNIFYPKNVQFIQPYIQTPACNYKQTYSAIVKKSTGPPSDYTTFSWLSLDKTTKTPSFGLEPAWATYSQQATDAGVYTVDQTVTLNDVYYSPQTTLLISFRITLVDPCITPGTAITLQNGVGQTFDSAATVPLLTTSVKFGTDVGSGTYTIKPFTYHDDSVSILLRSFNLGLPFVCGPRQYTLSFFSVPPAGGTSFQSVDSTVPQISIMTNNDFDIGLHRMKLTVELTNYVGIIAPIYEFFDILIESCIVKSITYTPSGGNIPAGNSATDPIIFDIFATSSYFMTGVWFKQVPLCGYPYSYRLQLVPIPGGPPEQKKWDQVTLSYVDTDTVAPSFSAITTAIVPYQMEFKSQSAEDDKCQYGVIDAFGIMNKQAWDTANINPYHMELLAEIQNNPVPPNNIVNTKSIVRQNNDIKFYIWPKDPCFQTTLISYQPVTMLTFVNSTLTEKQLLSTTKDTVSISYGAGTHDDYCGPRTYQVTTVAGAFVKYMTVMPGPPPIMTLKTNNPFDAGVKKLNFKTQLIKYPFIQTQKQFEVMIFYLEPGVDIGDQWYQVGTDELILTYQPFQIMPANASFSIDYQLRVTPVKPNSTVVTYSSANDDLPKWINYDMLQRRIIIYTSDAQYFGNYTVQVVAKVQQYIFVESINQFLLRIVLTPPPPQPNDPPYFTQSVKDDYFFVGEKWSYTLPKQDDHENNKITLRILQKPDWLKFDAETTTFFVDEGSTGVKQVGIYTVKILLSDTTTAKQEYTFLVEVKPQVVVVVPYVDPDINRPKPVIDNINPKGLVTVSWSKSMKTPRNITYIEKENTTYNDLASNIVDKKVRVMDVKVLRSKSSREKKNLNFTWEIKSFQQKTLLIQLWFDDPMQISYENMPEQLEIIFYEEAQFVGKEFGLPCRIGPDYNITKDIPPQIPPKTIKKVRTANNKVASALAQVGNVITQLMLSATLNQLWSLINTQQLIVMIPLFKIILPSNAAAFFAYVMQIAAFDIVPTDDIFGYIFQIPEGSMPEALNSNFDAVGFSTVYFFNNMGSLIFALISSPILAVVAKILFLFKNQPKFVRRAKKIERSIYWGSTLRVLLESYTVMVVCCAIQSTDYGFNSSTKWGPLLYSAVSIFYFAICFALPFFQAIFCYKNFDKLDDEKFEQKWGCLWEGMRITDKGFIAYNFVFLIRRLWLALSVVYSRHILFFQIAGLVFQIIISCIVTGQTRPFEDAKTNNMEFFNEIMIMLVLYNFMCFTDWQPDEKVQYYQGYVACGITLAHIFLNLFLMAQENIRLALLRYKKYRLWRDYAKVRSEAMHHQQKNHRDYQFYKARKFKIVDEAKNIVKKRQVNSRLESIEEIENSWKWEDQSGSQHVSYSYAKAESKESSFSNFTFSSIDDANKSESKSAIQDNNERLKELVKQPAEAPVIEAAKNEDIFDQSNQQHREQNRLLGVTRLVDAKLGMEKEVHSRLANVPVDTVLPDPRAIMDELWGLNDSTQHKLNKQPANEKRLDKEIKPGFANRLARQADQDVGSFATKSEDPREYRGLLKVTANKDQIHSKIFAQYERGDGSKKPAEPKPKEEEIKQAKSLKNEMPQSLESARFQKVLTDILDKPEQPNPTREIFGEMEFDFGQ